MPEWITDPRTIIAVVAAIGGIGYWVGRVNSDRKSFRTFMKEVRADLRQIRNNLNQVLWRMPSSFADTASPVKLNKRGELAASILNARDWADKWSVSLAKDCEGLKEYAIYRMCQEYVMDNRGRWPSNMDECAYQFGSTAEALSEVLEIELRDSILRRLGK